MKIILDELIRITSSKEKSCAIISLKNETIFVELFDKSVHNSKQTLAKHGEFSVFAEAQKLKNTNPKNLLILQDSLKNGKTISITRLSDMQINLILLKGHIILHSINANNTYTALVSFINLMKNNKKEKDKQ